MHNPNVTDDDRLEMTAPVRYDRAVVYWGFFHNVTFFFFFLFPSCSSCPLWLKFSFYSMVMFSHGRGRRFPVKDRAFSL
jgi:hypothetical protein